MKRTLGKMKNPKAQNLLNRPNNTSNQIKLQNRLNDKGRCGMNLPTTSKIVRQPQERQTDINGSKIAMENPTIKQEYEEMPTDETELVTFDFDNAGETISAKMSQRMMQLLNEDENLREQIIEKLITESVANPGQQIIIKELPTPSLQEPCILNTTEHGVSNNGKVAVVKGQSSDKSKKTVRTAHPVGNRLIAPLNKESNLPDEIYSMWREETVLTLIEVYESIKKQLQDKQYTSAYFWRTVCKKMKEKGYIRLTDKECQKKFESMEAIYKEEVEQGLTGETSTWEYFNTMAYLQNQSFQTPSLTPIAIPPKHIIDPTQSSMYESDEATSSDSQSSDDDVLSNLNSSKQEHPNKKRKVIPPEETGLELLRKTYMKVENRKLKEKKAMRKIQKQQNRLNAERNILLSSIVDLLRKNTVTMKRR